MKRMLQASAVVCLLAFGSLGSALAGALEEGIAAYDNGDFTRALARFKPLVEDGSVPAQAYLGMMYNNGYGVTRDYAEAQRLYRLAAAEGDARAQYNLGLLFDNGLGTVLRDFLVSKWCEARATVTAAPRPVRPPFSISLGSRPQRPAHRML